ncbi:PREDICTED: fatty acyl-CoA reductase 1-like [Cyphomyrmex costatus]|uniref:fatty acyl-CoA reductase 1-like n=1 Tax=Cyphomyrmex costatus TaxID=456900 RepID=UPI0008522A4E|nr:PREDICTED: fatty acyl-CoA reductase 1-like [Cyphomyrmex costatus]
MDKMTIDPAKSIPAFYAVQSILLTGATGFLGKVFVEKVLRSCPDVREIFLLMRPKRGSNVNERLEKILNLPLYEELRKEQRLNSEKLIPISGDIKEKDLGLSVADKQILIERVSIIIHAAGDVKLLNSFKYAILANTRATRDICILAQNMKNLIALVHISTAFTHVNEPTIEEKAYPPIADWQKIIKMAETLDEYTLKIFEAKCLDYFPNAYTFSKALAESVIQEYSSSLPCAIIRPSMVMPALKEPMPEWIDNFYGPIGLMIGIGKALIRVCYFSTACINTVPVDIVVNEIIVVTWKIGSTIFTDSTFIVLNCISQKNLTHQNGAKIFYKIMIDEVPLEGIVWTPNVIMTDNFVLYYILTILLHVLPAALMDLSSKFSRRRPMILQLQRQLYAANRAVSYFTFHNWKYINTNTSLLLSSIPSDDKDTFSFETAEYDMRGYIKTCIIGFKKFLLHEDMNRLDAVRARNKRVYLFVTIVETAIFIGLWIIYQRIYSYT